MKKNRNALPPGARIHWYIIRSVLGQGGFGITYLAEDTNLGRQVAIKEYMPAGMAVREQDSSVQPVTDEQGKSFRWGLERFTSEARTLARFKHSNIVQVYSVFTENNTAYMVMEYEQGHGLDRTLKEHKTLPETELREILMPLLDGLEQVHSSGFIHRDIKPANIFLRENGTPVLLDFGSARQALGGQTRTLTAMVSPGFAPLEQYTSKEYRQGPWTDIYGLGATLYRAVTGRAPPAAMDRSEAILHTSRDILVPALEIQPPGYSRSLLLAIDHALAFKPEARPRSIAAWRRILLDTDAKEETTAVASPDTVTEKVHAGATVPSGTPDPARPSLHRWKYILLAALVTLVLIILLQGPQWLWRKSANPDLSASEDPADNTIDTEIDRALTEMLSTDPVNTAAADDAVRVDDDSASPSRQLTRLRPAAPADTARIPAGVLRKRLQQNPRDRQALLELRRQSTELEQRIREAMRAKEYDKVERYLRELQSIAPQNPRLRTALRKLEQQRRR